MLGNWLTANRLFPLLTLVPPLILLQTQGSGNTRPSKAQPDSYNAAIVPQSWCPCSRVHLYLYLYSTPNFVPNRTPNFVPNRTPNFVPNRTPNFVPNRTPNCNPIPHPTSYPIAHPTSYPIAHPTSYPIAHPTATQSHTQLRTQSHTQLRTQSQDRSLFIAFTPATVSGTKPPIERPTCCR